MLEQVAAIGGCQRAAEHARIAPPPIMPKILYLVTEDWFFVSHFLPMAQAARDCGLQVAVATRVRADGERLKAVASRALHAVEAVLALMLHRLSPSGSMAMRCYSTSPYVRDRFCAALRYRW